MTRTLALLFLSLSLLAIGCGPKSKVPEISVLIKMMPAQEKFFREEVIKGFEKANQCKVKVVTFTDMWDIEATLKLEKGSRTPTIALVKAPFEMTRVLVGKGYMMPLAEVVDSLKLEQDIAEYHPLALGLGYADSRLYYLPRKLETRVLFYLKSKVADAVKNFPSMKAEINTALKKENGYGLPAGYTLEEDPNQWDYYDLLVVGMVWANTPYFGVKMPRVAFRGAKYEGTALGLIDQAIQLGATPKDILQLNSEPVIRMLQWHSQFVKNQVFNPAMWQDPMRGANIWEGVSSGKVFMATVQQIDCFFLHGWKNSVEMPGYMKDPDDMGLAVMPAGNSFALDEKGQPVYAGERKITTGGWWWGIPRTSPDAKLAYELARYITSHDIQAQECARFGSMPVRKDILNNLEAVFSEGWVGQIFEKSIEQIQINDITTIPLTPFYSDMGRNYIDLWYATCIPGGELKGPLTGIPDLRKAASGKFLDVQRRILGTEFPE